MRFNVLKQNSLSAAAKCTLTFMHQLKLDFAEHWLKLRKTTPKVGQTVAIHYEIYGVVLLVKGFFQYLMLFMFLQTLN